MMYPEVHTIVDGNLHWRGVKAQGSPNAIESHHIILESPTKMEDSIHYGTLEVSH
jgi:hypothetical protein